MLCKKQKVVDSFFQLLEDPQFSSKIGGRKAIVSNLTKNRFANALDLTEQLPKTIIEELSELWSATFELAVVVEGVGVVIYAFQEQETDITEDLREMINLASKIEDVSKDGTRFFVINATLGGAIDGVSPAFKPIWMSEGIQCDVNFFLMVMDVLNRFVQFLTSEVKTCEMARIGIVFEADIHSVSTAVDGCFESR